jgi:hypothetical protein
MKFSVANKKFSRENKKFSRENKKFSVENKKFSVENKPGQVLEQPQLPIILIDKNGVLYALLLVWLVQTLCWINTNG